MKLGDLVHLNGEAVFLPPDHPETKVIGTIIEMIKEHPDISGCSVQVLWPDGYLTWHLDSSLILVAE